MFDIVKTLEQIRNLLTESSTTMKNRLTRGALAASSLVLAMQLGFVSPASALTSDVTSVSPGETAIFSTQVPAISLVAIFVNGEFHSSGNLYTIPTTYPWETFSPCVTVDVTFRVYSEYVYGAPFREPLFSEQPAETADVEFIGDDSVSCNDAWGSGSSGSSGGSGGSEDSDEPLAKTGSDASTVAGMTGIASLTALAVAVAVARRTRRAQR